MFQLDAGEKAEVVTNGDHLAKLKYSKALRKLMTPSEPAKRPIGFVTQEEEEPPGSKAAARKKRRVS